MADDAVTPPEVRDDALARALDVEPLDELTRRRLVSGALAAAGQPDEAPAGGSVRARALGVAAAAVAFVVLGIAALTLPGGGGDDVALRDRTSRDQPAAAAPESAGAGAASTADASTASPKSSTGLPDLGRLGDVSRPRSRARVLAAAEPLVEGVAPQRWSFTFQQCDDRTLDVVATGLGTFDGHPAQIFVTRRADGTLRVSALDGTTCELRSLP
jgi:hypothetical protein